MLIVIIQGAPKKSLTFFKNAHYITYKLYPDSFYMIDSMVQAGITPDMFIEDVISSTIKVNTIEGTRVIG